MSKDCLHCAVFSAIVEYGKKHCIDMDDVVEALANVFADIVSNKKNGSTDMVECFTDSFNNNVASNRKHGERLPKLQLKEEAL